MFSPPGSRGLAPNHTIRPAGGKGRPLNATLLDTVNARDFGAVGDGKTDDTIAMQAAINAAQNAAGTTLYVPAGVYKITSNLSITKHINMVGAGPQGLGDTGGQFYPGGGIVNLPSANAGTAFLCSSNAGCIVVSTPDAVTLRDFMVFYPTQPAAASGVTAINFNISSAHTNVGSVIDNVTISGPDRGLQMSNCVSFIVRDSYFWEHSTYGFATFSNGTALLSAGDYTVTGCSFLSGSAATCKHMFLQSTGGPRIVNNKLNTAGSVNTSVGIEINLNVAGTSMEPVLIVGNSIEGLRTSVNLTASSSNASSTQGVISGNQMWGSNSTSAGISGRNIQYAIGGTATGQPFSGWSICGNYLQVDGGGSSTAIIFIANASVINIVGNTFGSVSSGGTVAISQVSSLNSQIQDTANLRGPNVT